MQSSIVLTAIAMIVSGAVVLNYQRTGKRKLEFLLILLGVTLVVCGLAALRDVATGSTKILWVISPAPSSDAPVQDE